MDARRQPADRRHRQPADPRGGGQHRHVLRPGDDRRATSTPWPATAPRGSPATAARPPTPSSADPTACGGRRRQPGGRRHLQQPGPVVAASTGTFYGQAMTNGRYLHRRRNARRVLRRRRPSHQRRTQRAVRGGGGRHRQPADRRHLQQPDPRGGASTGTFYGQAMTAGHIYTVAGNGTRVLRRRRSATEPSSLPQGASGQTGNMLIADTHQQRIRVVAAAQARSTARR